MDVFISWSGERSHQVAIALHDWLPNVLQSVRPYVSSEDIEKGARWSTDIARRLDDSTFGVVCVTPENVGAPWLNFEAGALAKRFDTSRVSPFLHELDPADITGPLAQFQATQATQADLTRLVRSLNTVAEHPLDEQRLGAAVKLWWSDLDAALSVIPASTPEPQSERDEGDILVEVLELVRSIQRRLTRLESPPTLEQPLSFGEAADEVLAQVRNTSDDRALGALLRRALPVIAVRSNADGVRHVVLSSDATPEQVLQTREWLNDLGFGSKAEISRSRTRLSAPMT